MDERIKKMMAMVLGIDIASIKDDASAENIEGWDSLKHVSLMIALEEEFSVRFDSEEMIGMMNFAAIKEVITNKCKE